MKETIFIEIPKGSKAKYEYCYKKNALVLDRFLDTPYPFNYGFIPGTVWEDGDALDAIVICEESLISGSYLSAKPIGYFEMYDNGISDFKVVFSVGNVNLNEEIQKCRDFLLTYKKGVVVLDFVKNKVNLLEVLRKGRK